MGELAAKERPILFSGPMVRAILDGRKTQTRRILKRQPVRSRMSPPFFTDVEVGDIFIGPDLLADDPNHPGLVFEECESKGVYHCMSADIFAAKHCPYGQPGDRLWVKEAWQTGKLLDSCDAAGIAAKATSAGYPPSCPRLYPADGHVQRWGDNDTVEFGEWGRKRSSRFMPRWASRITLEITDVRLEQLQDISEADAQAEGIYRNAEGCGGGWRYAENQPTFGFASSVYRELWNEINGEGAWDTNPWVWVVSFKQVQA